MDRTLILRKLSQLEEYLKQVEEFSSITLSEYSADWKTQRIVERTLQMMVEISIDIAGHIVSDKRFRIPTSYADAFRVLMENNCITATLCQSLERMAKFRNVVVHHYGRVDEAIVLAILKKHLSDFLLFRDAILSTLTEDRQ